MRLTAEVRGGAAIARKLAKAGLWGRPAERVIRDASAFAIRETQAGAPRDTGAFAGSFVAEVSALEGRIASRHPGARALELGRKPGAKMPPPGALARYGRAAFVIARAIARRGYRGRFFMRKARTRLLRTELPRLIERAKREISDAWAGEAF